MQISRFAFDFFAVFQMEITLGWEKCPFLGQKVDLIVKRLFENFKTLKIVHKRFFLNLGGLKKELIYVYF